MFDHFQFALIHGPDISGSYAILLFTASDLASITSHIHNWILFLLWLHPFILSGASPELGLWAGTQTRRIRPQQPAHVSAGEESAREPTSVIHFLGTQGISLRLCGDENPSQGPWEPGALGAALILGGLETAGGALQLPFPSL